MYTIGIDIGGMSIKVGLVDENGKIIDSNRLPTASTPNGAVEGMVNQINDLLDKRSVTVEDIRGIGIGCPGLLSSDKGIVDHNSNMKWHNFPLTDMLKKHFNTRIKLSNDANVAALGETIYGAAKKYKDVVMITLGTGVGGGIVIDNKIYEGGFSKGAELGHMVVETDGVQCGCGRHGCLEAYASATGFIRMTKEAMLNDKDSAMWAYVDGDINKVSGRTAFECSKKGDPSANAVVDKFVKYLSEGLMNFMNIFRPEAFIIGGGLSGQGDYLIDKIKAYCEKFHYGYINAPVPEILTAELGNDAGIIGAAALID